MHLQWLLGAIIVAVVTGVACPTITTADEPGAPRKLKGVGGTIASSPDNLGGALAAEPDGNAAVAYGFVTVAGKPRFTYFLLFKVDPAKVKSHGQSIGAKGDLKINFGPEAGALPLEVRLGDKKVEFAYKFDVDRKAGTISESIKIGGKEYSKDVPRVFLVDLTQDKITYAPVKDAVPEPAGGVDEVATSLRRLEEKHAEVKEFFAGKAKK
ncbi:MAG TPA: hypothetical protein VFA26_00930 [Gemmataceae bacterium]|nr:hypothetical protein [Gemmataceae bacterium]